MRELTYREAVREALREEMKRDSSVFMLGEEIAEYGGSYKVTQGLVDEFGHDRIRNTPLAEAAIAGAALGAASVGMRPIDVMQIPVFCMDGSLFYRDITVDEAVDTVKSYVSTIKKFGGLGSIDWHVRTSYPGNTEYEDWARAYLKVLEWLSADEEIWTTNAGSVETWTRNHFKMLSLRKSLP